MIYGIQASRDVKQSNVSRALQEGIPLSKTEDRLSRNPGDIDFTSSVSEQLMWLGNLQHNKIVPLYCEAYSSEEPGYASAAEKIKGILTIVKNHIDTGGHLGD